MIDVVRDRESGKLYRAFPTWWHNSHRGWGYVLEPLDNSDKGLCVWGFDLKDNYVTVNKVS
jgi:hypothetical protein